MYVLVLAMCFAGSIHMASKHRQEDAYGHDNNLLNDSKRLRAERNSFLSFGSLFLALVLSQLWALLKRVIELVRRLNASYQQINPFFSSSISCINPFWLYFGAKPNQLIRSHPQEEKIRRQEGVNGGFIKQVYRPRPARLRASARDSILAVMGHF